MAEVEPPTGLCPISFLDNLDICDLENYQHPPFMWTLWYLALLGKAVYDKVKEILESEGGDSEGGDGGDDKKEDDKPEEEPAAAEEEAPAEEAPPAEEEAG